MTNPVSGGFQFTPATGLNDTVTYPTTPVNEAAARQQVMDFYWQLMNEMNLPTLSASAYAQYNKLINGNFDVWQRGVSFNSPNLAYTVDRWKISNTVDSNIKVLQSTSVPNAKSKYSMRVECFSAASGASAATDINQQIADYTLFSGQKATFSGYVKCDAGASFTANIYDGTTNTTSAAITSTSWTQFKITATVGASPSQLNIYGHFNRAGLAVGVGINLSQCQLNVGDQALPFQPRSTEEEKALCLPYFEVVDFSAGQPAIAQGTANCYSSIRFTKKRVTPTCTPQTTGGVSGQLRWDTVGVSNDTVATTTAFPSLDSVQINTTATTSSRNWVVGKLLVDAEI